METEQTAPVEELEVTAPVEAPEAESTSETEATAAPETTEPEAHHEKMVPLAALESERRKRQEYEGFIAQMRQEEHQRQQAAQQAQQPAGPPRLENFQDYETYQQAVIDHRVQAQIAAVVQRQQVQQQVTAFQSRATAAADRPADYHERIDALMQDSTLPVSQTMADVILQDEAGPDLAYHLSAHPGELRRIAALHPARQAAELGRLAAKLTDKPPARVSAAPAPVNPVRSSNARDTQDQDKMSTDDWIRQRNKQIASRKR